MIHYDNLIKAEKMKYYNDYETLLFARAKGNIKSVTGVLPLTFTAKGGTAADWVIYGNDENGTENRFDINNFTEGRLDDGAIGYSSDTTNLVVNDNSVSCTTGRNFRGIVTNNMISLSAGAYTFCIAGYNDALTSTISKLAVYNMQGEYENQTTTGGAEWVNAGNYAYYTFTVNESKKIRISFEWYNAGNHTVSNIMLVKGSTAPDHYIPYQQGVGEQRVDGYYVPLTISQAGQPDKTYDIYIGDTPLTEGQQVSKTSTGQDIELFEGENTVDTSLYNKPEMKLIISKRTLIKNG